MIGHLSTVMPISTLPQRDLNVSAAQTQDPTLPPVSGAAPKDGVSSNTQQSGGNSLGRSGTSSQHQRPNSEEHSLEFSIDKASGDLVVKVVNSETREVIRQIPREEVLAFAQHVKEYKQGHHGGLLQVKV